MIKNFLIISGFAVLLVSCGNNADSNVEGEMIDTTVVAEEVVEVKEVVLDINKFDEEYENYIGQAIEIEGTCVHTCKHGGGKMHMIGNDPEKRVVIIASDESGKFDAEMEGSTYKVIVKVSETRIDSVYLANWEAEIMSENDVDSKDGVKHSHNHEGDDATEAEEREHKLAQVDDMRNQLAESEKEYLSSPNLECVSYKKVEAKEVVEEEVVEEVTE